jgi:hypothetical protein
MNHDAVFYGVIASVVGSVVVVAWLLYVTVRNATKGEDKQ